MRAFMTFPDAEAWQRLETELGVTMGMTMGQPRPHPTRHEERSMRHALRLVRRRGVTFHPLTLRGDDTQLGWEVRW